MDSILKMGLVFFVCLLSFAVGTYVGKKFSDYNHQVAVYEPQNQTTPENEVEGGGGSETPKEAATETPKEGDATGKMTDSDVAEIAKEFATPGSGNEKVVTETADERMPASDTDKSAPAKIEDLKPEVKDAPTPAEHLGAQVPGAGHAKASPTALTPATVAPAAAKAETAVSMADGQYTIQIASLPNEKEAKEKAAALKGQNYVAFYLPAKVNGKTWYRVNVGLFSSAEEAKKFKTEKFAAKPEYASALVQKIVRGPASGD